VLRRSGRAKGFISNAERMFLSLALLTMTQAKSMLIHGLASTAEKEATAIKRAEDEKPPPHG